MTPPERATPPSHLRARRQQGFTLMGLLFWGVLIAVVAVIGMRIFPSVNEYLTIQRTVNKLAASGATSVAELRNAFERQKDVEYSISSISGKDLEITKENDRIVISFAYEKEVELMPPVYLLIKYEGRSQ
jgi:Tfp pilus assembly protein FimT